MGDVTSPRTLQFSSSLAHFAIDLNPFAASLNLLGRALKWHRLDDGVMGGQSETVHSSAEGADELNFAGHINTQGGGFCSIRSPIEGGLPSDTAAIRVIFVGDGKTYKVLFSDGNKKHLGRVGAVRRGRKIFRRRRGWKKKQP